LENCVKFLINQSHQHTKNRDRCDLRNLRNLPLFLNCRASPKTGLEEQQSSVREGNPLRIIK